MRNLICHILIQLILTSVFKLDVATMYVYAMKGVESPEEMIAYSRLRKAVFKTREDARTALSEARAIAKKYGNVSLADILNLSGVETRFVDEGVFWEHLTRAYVIPTSAGYRLVLGKPSEV